MKRFRLRKNFKHTQTPIANRRSVHFWLLEWKSLFESHKKFDHCESLLSDLEFMNKPSSTPKVCKKETKKVAGMETIKRQMDSLTEMVNDLQVTKMWNLWPFAK